MKIKYLLTIIVSICFASSTFAKLHHGLESELPPPLSPTKLTTPKQISRSGSPSCDIEKLITHDSQAFLKEVQRQGYDCINNFQDIGTTLETKIYTQEHVLAAAAQAANLSQNYLGKGDSHLATLFYFMRIGYYVEFYNKQITYTKSAQAAAKLAIDSFVSNGHFYNNSDEHGTVLTEVITLMDSAKLQHEYIDIATQWLKRWDRSYAKSAQMRNALNGTFYLLYRGLSYAPYKNIIGQKTDLAHALGDFSLQTSLIGTQEEILLTNAARELARLSSIKNTPITPIVDNYLKKLFSSYPQVGDGGSVWLAAAEVVSFYKRCGDFNVCNYQKGLYGKVFTRSSPCQNNITVVSQAMNTDQVLNACKNLQNNEIKFHSQLETNRTPVKNDLNTRLQVNAFKSVNEYEKYARLLFGIDSNNGGMYLEGTPSKVGNLAKFIAYQSPDTKHAHKVWNLEHEYIHYLDGRYNLHGSFTAPTEPVVWWAEGLAEYISKSDANPDAISTLQDGSTYTLSAVFESNYVNYNLDRIYYWGYLAVRFMLEKHKDEVNKMLIKTRTGDWKGYKKIVDRWATQFQAEFEQWQCDKIDLSTGKPSVHIVSQQSGKVGEKLQLTQRSCSSNGFTPVSYLWTFSDGTVSKEATPSHSFKTGGKKTVTLRVKDKSGEQASSTTVINIIGAKSGGGKSGGAIDPLVALLLIFGALIKWKLPSRFGTKLNGILKTNTSKI
ncbi:collagenase [Vibrio sp. 10N.222.49.B4]|uniref:collagenase n=1 Tax=Vibrio sp. 10N.222.49.B4 TaxID=3229613 RepID=UPI003552A424